MEVEMGMEEIGMEPQMMAKVQEQATYMVGEVALVVGAGVMVWMATVDGMGC